MRPPGRRFLIHPTISSAHFVMRWRSRTPFDPLTDNFSNSSAMLLHLEILHRFGHNLEIAESSEKAEAEFGKQLALVPNARQASFRCGMSYAVTIKNAKTLPYLGESKAPGIVNANYWWGHTYTALAQNDKATGPFWRYLTRVPGDVNTAFMLDAVANDNIDVKHVRPSNDGE